MNQGVMDEQIKDVDGCKFITRKKKKEKKE
jgi:hypothetical protein